MIDFFTYIWALKSWFLMGSPTSTKSQGSQNSTCLPSQVSSCFWLSSVTIFSFSWALGLTILKTSLPVFSPSAPVSVSALHPHLHFPSSGASFITAEMFQSPSQWLTARARCMYHLGCFKNIWSPGYTQANYIRISRRWVTALVFLNAPRRLQCAAMVRNSSLHSLPFHSTSHVWVCLYILKNESDFATHLFKLFPKIPQ